MLSYFIHHPQVLRLCEALKRNEPEIVLEGLKGSGGAVVLASLYHLLQKKYIVVLHSEEAAAYLYDDLLHFVPQGHLYLFPHISAGEENIIGGVGGENVRMQLRTEVLLALSERSSYLLVTYPEAVCEKVVARQAIKSCVFGIKKGEKLSTAFLSDFFNEYGFERVDFVTEPGQFSVRGNIVDVFSFSNDKPFRVVLDDEQVDAIRYFDPISQRSIHSVEEVKIVPNMEGKRSDLEYVDIFEYAGKEIIVWVDRPLYIKERIKVLSERRFEQDKNKTTVVPTQEKLFMSHFSWDLLACESRVIYGDSEEQTVKEGAIVFHQEHQPLFHKNFKLLGDSWIHYRQKGYACYFLSRNPSQCDRISKILESTGHVIPLVHLSYELHEGFIDHHLKKLFYTDHQIFDRFHGHSFRHSAAEAKASLSLRELQQLQPGDYVVHIDHGIGRFSGLEKIKVGERIQEAIRLVYKNNDILYVNIHSLHKISRYKGESGEPPALDKLGGGRWQLVKQRTKNKIKTLAFDLIQLYARRKMTKGFAFSPDNYLQQELESSFMYEDTPDQEKATEEIKKDMEKPYPMDRLVCGDVGFGKTELAIRAAFKAVCDNKQVAVLVPTTILAYQHYRTFSDRLKGFPCKVEYINRIRSAATVRRIKDELKEGKIDILIGTHRILSKDIEFKDLGLLIIDEEHKFGVGDKEKIKNLKINVDTLTLTATPIPRTLQFSLMGARDLSILTTPPPNRRPVTTKVIGFDMEIIRDAIYREVQRGGQVFFIHNRVEGIQELTELLQKTMPDVRFRFAHGKMKGTQLEEILLSFIYQEFDVLVSTTIIESGLDIPNANTIFINQAHQFGISDLHQLRGRVGRSNQKAYCYLITPPLTTLSSDARRRIIAIEQYTELGSGFHLAMIDLDIRGAGNILGAEQSGFISEIGYETYQKILQEAMTELRQNECKDLYDQPDMPSGSSYVTDCVIDTDWELYIPESYIESLTERLQVYTEISKISNKQEAQRLIDSLEDRFGQVPEAIRILISLSLIRQTAILLGFDRIVLKNNTFSGYFVKDKQSAFYQSDHFGNLLKYLQRHSHHVSLKQATDSLRLVVSHIDSVESLHALIQTLYKVMYDTSDLPQFLSQETQPFNKS